MWLWRPRVNCPACLFLYPCSIKRLYLSYLSYLILWKDFHITSTGLFFTRRRSGKMSDEPRPSTTVYIVSRWMVLQLPTAKQNEGAVQNTNDKNKGMYYISSSIVYGTYVPGQRCSYSAWSSRPECMHCKHIHDIQTIRSERARRPMNHKQTNSSDRKWSIS